MRSQKQITFKKGCLDGQRFTEVDTNEFSAPSRLVDGLKKLGFKSPDLDLYFAQFTRDPHSKDMYWEINENYSNKTFGFHRLKDLVEQRDEIKRRSDLFIEELSQFSKQIVATNTQDKKLVEALNNILKHLKDKILYAGFNEQEKTFFPVVIAWGGKFQPDTGAAGELIGVDDPKVKPPIDGDSPLRPIRSGVTWGFLPFYWLLWLIIFLLSLFIIFKLIPSCGLRWVGNTCSVEKKIIDDLPILEQYLERLTSQSLVRHNLCLSVNEKVETLPEKELRQDSPVIKERLDREGATNSDLSVALAWNTEEDLDLSIECPNGKRVSHTIKSFSQNQCGDLDIDANYQKLVSKQPVEHIILNPSTGIYKIIVRSVKNTYSRTNKIPTPFEVEVNNFGEMTLLEGEVLPGQETDFTFEKRIDGAENDN